MAEFNEWLNQVERQLDTVCFCMILAWEAKDTPSVRIANGNDTTAVDNTTISSRDVADLKDCSLSAISGTSFMESGDSCSVVHSTPIKKTTKRRSNDDNECNDDEHEIKKTTSGDDDNDSLDIEKPSAKHCQSQSKIPMAITTSIPLSSYAADDGREGEKTNTKGSRAKHCQQNELIPMAMKTSIQSYAVTPVGGKHSGIRLDRLWRLALQKQKVRETCCCFFFFGPSSLILVLLVLLLAQQLMFCSFLSKRNTQGCPQGE